MTDIEQRWPAGQSEMARRIRAHDWAETPLGAIEQWPASLRGAVELMLANAVACCIHYGPSRTLLFNDALGQLLGAAGGALFTGGRDALGPLRGAFEPYLDEVFAGQAVLTPEGSYELGGAMPRVALSHAPLRDERGNVAGVFSIALVGTPSLERQQREHAEHMRAALVAARMASWHWTPRTGDLIVSDAVDELLGLLPEHSRLHGLQAFELVHPDDREAHRAATAQALAEGRGWRRELRIVRPRDGRVVWLEERAMPIHDPHTHELSYGGVMWDVSERKRAEQAAQEAQVALRKSEERYRMLFESMDEAYCTIEVLFDEHDRAYDYRFLEVNSAFEPVIGLRNVVGRTVRELLPDIEEHWLQRYGEIVRTGKPCRFDAPVPQLGRWFDGYAFRIGGPESRVLAVVSSEISERKRLERELLTNQARQTYLLRLSDALRPIADPVLMQEEAARVLGEHLAVSRAFYAETQDGQHFNIVRDYHGGGVRPLNGRYTIDDFGPALMNEMRQGRLGVVSDISREAGLSAAEREAYAEAEISAYVGAPLHKEGRWVGLLGVHSSVPRTWTTAEILIVQETAERTWAALARLRAENALRASEAKYRTLFDSIDDGFMIAEIVLDEDGNAVDFRCLEENPGAVRHAGKAGKGRLASEFDGSYEADVLEVFAHTARSGEARRVLRFAAHTSRWFDCYAFKPHGVYDEHSFGVIVRDVTSHRRAEQALRRAAAYDAFRVALSDRLRPGVDVAELKARASRLLGEHLCADRAFFSEIREQQGQSLVQHDYAREGLASVSGYYPLSDFAEPLSALRRGRPFFVEDTVSSPALSQKTRDAYRALGVRSVGAVGLLRNGSLHWALIATLSAPHAWSQDEIALMQEVAERTWTATEQARAEAALRESEERHRLIIECARDYAILTTDLEGRIESWSPGAAAVYGWTSEEAIGASLSMTFTPEDQADCIPEQERELSLRDGLALDVRWHARKDGGRVFIDGVSRTLPDGQGNARGFLKLGVDVTQRRQDEEALRDGAARDAFRVELIDVLRPLMDPAEIQARAARVLGEHLRADRVHYGDISEDGTQMTILRQYGTTLPALEGSFPLAQHSTMLDLLRQGRTVTCHDVANDSTMPRLARKHYALAGVGALVVVPLLKAGRLTATIAVHQAHPRAWSRNEVVMVEETAERTWSAIERARAQGALRESEARFRTLVDNVRDYAIFLLDNEGIVSEWTAGAGRIKGYATSEIVGRHLSVFFLPEEAQLAGEELAEAAASGRAEREGWRVRKDGSCFWAHEIATAVRDARGRLVGFTKVSRDLSEQKRLEEQREQLLEAARAAQVVAEQANRAKDDFLATLSHELRTPLAPILLWSRALQANAVPWRDMGRAVDAIVHSAESQARLVDDLLDLSRLTSGRLPLSLRSTSVESVARAAIEVTRPGAQAKGVALDLEVQEGLGAAMLDPDRFQQVLWNLLSNAVKFTPAGGCASLRVWKQDGELRVEVRDSGQGIRGDFIPHLFQRFSQEDAGEKRQHAGLGIGLALCRHLIKLHGGEIEAHSDGPGRGATFQLHVPWVEGAPVGEEQPNATRGAPPPGLRVLLVEDDEHMRVAMRWTLERAGAEVTAVDSASDALALLEAGALRNAAPQVIFCDIGLPGMSGYELMQRIVEHCRERGRPSIPACAVSAHARDVDRQRAIEAGFALHLAKPVSAQALVRAAEALATVARTN